jgi:hypothetical protein
LKKVGAAPWTAWSKMIQPQRRSRFFILFHNNQSQITNNSSPPRSPLRTPRLGVSILSCHFTASETLALPF